MTRQRALESEQIYANQERSRWTTGGNTFTGADAGGLGRPGSSAQPDAAPTFTSGHVLGVERIQMPDSRTGPLTPTHSPRRTWSCGFQVGGCTFSFVVSRCSASSQ